MIPERISNDHKQLLMTSQPYLATFILEWENLGKTGSQLPVVWLNVFISSGLYLVCVFISYIQMKDQEVN